METKNVERQNAQVGGTARQSGSGNKERRKAERSAWWNCKAKRQWKQRTSKGRTLSLVELQGKAAVETKNVERQNAWWNCKAKRQWKQRTSKGRTLRLVELQGKAAVEQRTSKGRTLGGTARQSGSGTKNVERQKSTGRNGQGGREGGGGGRLLLSYFWQYTGNLGHERNSSVSIWSCERDSDLQKRDVHPFEINIKARHSSSLMFLETGQLTEGGRTNLLIQESKAYTFT